MKYLLDNRFAPVTFDWGFFEKPAEDIAEDLADWMERLGRPGELVHFQDKRFPESLFLLEPLTNGGRNRDLLLETDSAWTAYFTNGSRVVDTGAVDYLAEAGNCRALKVSCRPDKVFNSKTGWEDIFGAVGFAYYPPGEIDLTTFKGYRNVICMRENKRFHFETHGEPLPFENLEYYIAHKKRDRFTSEMLEEYCAALGIRLFDPDFYGSKGVLVIDESPLPKDHEKVTIKDARAWWGFEDEEKPGERETLMTKIMRMLKLK